MPLPRNDAALADAMRLHQAGDLKRARIAYQNLARANPDDPQPERLLAELDVREGLLVSARRRLETLARKHPAIREVETALAGVAEELGDSATAVEIYTRDATASPGDAHAQLRLATALRSAGRLAEAAAVCRRFIATWPDSAAGYVSLITLDPAALSAEETSRLRNIAESAPSAAERVQAYFAIGDVLDRAHAYDDAFAAYTRGAALHVAGLSTPARDINTQFLTSATPAYKSLAEAESGQLASLAAARATHSREFLSRHSGNGLDSPAPIFIVGMPRSGSTLLEQILSSHPDVQGLGETLAFPNTLARESPAVSGIPFANRERPFFRRVGETYLAALQELGWTGHGRVIDKLPGNFVNVAGIHLALPRATIVHSLRDPVDTCFSCFRHLFRDRNETTYDLASMGRYYVAYRALMSYWDELLPARVHHIRYEDLLADPEGQIRKLIAACGLPWNDACLQFHQSDRAVKTSSAAQVRTPLFASSVHRWKPYERHLAPLLAALGPYAVEGRAKP